MNRRISCLFIKPFVRKNNIDLSEYEPGYKSFNEFFTRKIKNGKRPIDIADKHLISPCDAYLTAYKIQDGLVLPIKQSFYSIASLLQNDSLADRYHDGICLVFRLCVNHYHRYCYIDDGKKGENIFIPGFFHTVRPVALESVPVFIENQREYTTIDTKNFGLVTQIEVGALMVGKIKNHDGASTIKRGEEKGMFLFGGSTIILLLEKEVSSINDKFFQKEVEVKMGEVIGEKI